MPSLFPDGNDSFLETTTGETTTLSSSGNGNRNHLEHHRDLGDAVEAIEANVPLLGHDHSGIGPRPTNKLKQANTHENADTDIATGSIHHTLGVGPFQAAAGNHTHDYNGPTILGQPYVKCTSTTRPANPDPGMMIYETDTHRIRVWDKIPPLTAYSWRLSPAGVVPFTKVRQGTKQTMYSNGSVVEWRVEIEDTFNNFNPATSLTEWICSEAGLYEATASIAWSTVILSDRAAVGFRVNGVPTNSRHWELVRSISFPPGFSQNTDTTDSFRLNVGDRVTVETYHNSFFTQETAVGNYQESRWAITYIGL